jgi:flagellar biosynthesis chaperone FliJ
MQESPGAITRGEAATYLKPAREQLKSIADEIAQVGEAIKGIGSDEASKRLEKSSIAEWLQSPDSAASLLSELEQQRKQIQAANNRIDQQLAE